MTSAIPAGVLALSLLMHGGDPARARAHLVVDDDRRECPHATFATIQAALDAARPGEHVRVCPGTYREQLRIARPVHLSGEAGAAVMPERMVANAASPFDGKPIAAAILVDGAERVVLEGLTVDGSANGVLSCSPVVVGVFYRNASGRLSDLVVRDVRLQPGLEGCQSGNGILVQSGPGAESQVEVEEASVHGYQKNGITGTEPGTHLSVRRSVVTGSGPTAGAAQNGIQVGPGARGLVQDNTVANHVYAPCASAESCPFVATDVLLVGAADAVVSRNALGRSQVGVYLQADRATVHSNFVFDATPFDGVLVLGDRNHVIGNTIVHSGEAAVFLLGDGNRIAGNRIQDAPVGIWKYQGSSGNAIHGNRFANTPIAVLDPPWPAVPAAAAYR